MATELWFEMLSETISISMASHQPMTFDASTTVLPFGPYDSGGGVWKFRTCFRFQTANPASRNLYALTLGSAFFYPAQGSEKAKIVIVRADDFGVSCQRHQDIRPLYCASPAFFVYENVDPAEARNVAVTVFSAPEQASPIVELLQKNDPQFVPKTTTAELAGQLADLWLSNGLPGGMLVEGGQLIGACDIDASSSGYMMELRMVRSIDPPATFFFNPAYEFVGWMRMGWLKDTPVFPELIDLGAPYAGTGVIHTVSGGGSNLITNAISSASAGDTILILDNQTYTDEIVIPAQTPVSIVSTAQAGQYAGYPTIDGGNVHRPITILGPQSPGDGIAFIGKLIVKNGEATGARLDGGGILIEKADQTVVSNCWIHHCNAPGLGPITEVYHPALFGEGFGGGIAAYHCSPAIYGCKVENNEARGRGKGIGIFGYGWPIVFDTTVQFNGFNSTGGRMDGGGIGIEIAVTNVEDPNDLADTTPANMASKWDPGNLERAKREFVRIVDSTVSNNNAEDDGGGIYLSVMGGTYLRKTTVSGNKSASNGGGIRVTMGSTLVTRESCVISGNTSNKNSDAVDSKGVGGGGLSIRNADLVDLADIAITGNTAIGWAGGGVSFLSTDEGTYTGTLPPGKGPLTYDWNDILWNVFGHGLARLSIDPKCVFSGNTATHLSGQADHGKGAALYVLRFVGPRESGLPLPANRNDGNGKLKAPPIDVLIQGSQTALTTNNTASFPGSDRLYLDDQTVPTQISDAALLQGESTGQTDFIYP